MEELARRRGLQLTSGDCACRLASGDGFVIGTPETYMNRSGYTARCLRDRLEVEPDAMLIVYDDVALPLGALRVRKKGGPGGQKGMASVIENLRTAEIPRLRLGVAPVAEERALPDDLVDFVLTGFDGDEAALAADQIREAADACEYWLEHGTGATMNRFNATARDAAV